MDPRYFVWCLMVAGIVIVAAVLRIFALRSSQKNSVLVGDGVYDGKEYLIGSSHQGLLGSRSEVKMTVVQFKGKRPCSVDGELSIRYPTGTHIKILRTKSGDRPWVEKVKD